MPLIETQPNFTLLNGIACSNTDIQVTFLGTPGALISPSAIPAINWSSNLDEGFQMSGGRPVARSSGVVTNEASWSCYRSDYQMFLALLAAAAPKRMNGAARLSLALFMVHIIFTPPGSTSVYETLLKGCRVKGWSMGSQEGSEVQKVEVPLSPLEIVEKVNGLEICLL